MKNQAVKDTLRKNRFIESFTKKALKKVLIAYQIPCSNYKNDEAIKQAIKESDLTIKQIWDGFIKYNQ